MYIQTIDIRTKNKRVFSVHLEQWGQDHYECKLAAINLGPPLPADATFGPFTKGTTALAAYRSLISGLKETLLQLDATDSISVTDNPCNAPFVTATDQKNVLGQDVVVKVNGVNA